MLLTLDDSQHTNYSGFLATKSPIRPPARDPRVRLVPGNVVLFWQDEHQPHAIEVIDGAIRAVRLWSDGTRQIVTFFWPGSIIAPAALQRYTAETLTRCTLRPREDVVADEPGGTDQALLASLRLLAATGKNSATIRMAWFLLQIREHLPRDTVRSNAFRVVIPRNDIADYLGMTLETACRTLATFRAQGLIDLPTRKTICYIDIPRLIRIASSQSEGATA
ncbi:Crp/Fnr family transcriptional regulator [Starkeya sp. ORNL1]|uniref:Crp/Fnr family transcriptional regulator n=1 Tax=Starkeya sp. ORNL1 TaxID=2709380 RepID=UPI0014647E27|nr:Crp/Fnr family transcriptional regulator [Starkeya sp. ORNL1]QJP14819.1 Crp/Fnr family transcriptional regulator [Starkeya sp. ORNL1]